MDLLAEGEDALRRGAWREARLGFERALEAGESARALEGLGNACRWLSEPGPTCRAFTRAYRLYRQAGEPQAAARVALQLALVELYFRNEPAVCRGWLERAERLVSGLGPTTEEGWVQLVRAHLALQIDRDPQRALEHARAAQETGSAAGDLDVETTGLAFGGLALVGLGEVEQGMRALDEATAAAVGGELENLDAISATCCALIDACKRVRDFERAAQWCDQVTEFCERWSDRLTFVACRAHYADVLIWRGAWAEAEAELLGTLGPLAAVHRARLADSLVRLAELRRRQGRVEQAAELLAQAASHRLGIGRPDAGPASLVAAAFALVTAIVLADFFRAARLQGNVAFDAWSFWVPKAKAIYYFGGLDEQLFRTLPGPSYPLLVPALQAMDFHLMGSADQTTIALQYWFLFVGFLLAVWGLLRPLVRPVVIWPVLALATVLPELDRRLVNAQADWPLDIFFALAALCLALWLVSREPWLLVSCGVLLAATMATKREGQLLAGCLVGGTLVATWRSWRRTWPWVVGVPALAFLVNVPWRIWWTSRHLLPDTPDSGVGTLSATLSRVGPSIRIVLELLFSYGLWSVVVPIAVAAAVGAVLRRDYRLPTLFLATSVLAVAGFTWILWSIPSLPLDTSQQTPIPRAVGALVLLSVAFAPLLISRLDADAR